MIEYIYFVKCPNCEDEPFNFFNEAKEFALGCLGSKPIITQVEVNRNDFGECTDSCDLGTIWSWEDVMSDVSADEPAVSVFTQGDFAKYNPDNDPEFTALDNTLDYVPDNFRRPSSTKYESLSEQPKTWICWYEGSDIGTVEASTKEEAEEAMMNQFPEYQYNNTDWGVEEAVSEVCHKKPIPAGMTIESLVEEMEENEDTVECKWCNELFDKSEVRYEVDLGYLCSQCEAGIKSRGETLTFREGPLEEAFNGNEQVAFEYEDLTITLQGPMRNVDDWDEVEYSDDYTYEVDKNEVATVIWENFITEEDVTDVEGGLEALDDDIAWNKFLETHFDALLNKYHDKLLEYFKEAATEEFEANYTWDDYNGDREAQYGDDLYTARHEEELYGDLM